MKTQDLLNALTTIKPGLGNTELIEQSTNFAFSKNCIFTHNNEISISHKLDDLNIEQDCAVPAKELYQFLNKVTTQDINISIEDDRLILEAGRNKAWFPINKELKLQKPDYENIPWNKIPEGFLNQLDFVSQITSTDATTPDLTAVCINGEKNLLLATDNYRAIIHRTQQIPFDATILLPAEYIPFIMKIKPEYMQVSSDKKLIYFKTEDNKVFMSCRLFNGEFKDMTSLFKGLPKIKEITFPKQISQTIEKAQIFIQEQRIFDQKIDVEITQKGIIISTQSHTGGFEGKIGVKAQIEDNIKFLISPLAFKNIVEKDDYKCYYIKEPSNRLFFVSKEWKYLTVINTK